MTKEQYWKAHVAKNPKFENESANIQMSVGMLRKLMEEAYDKGFEQRGQIADKFKEVMDKFSKMADSKGENPFEKYEVK